MKNINVQKKESVKSKDQLENDFLQALKEVSGEENPTAQSAFGPRRDTGPRGPLG